MNKYLHDIDSMSQLLSMSKREVWVLIRQGILPAYRIKQRGKKWFMSDDKLRKWVNETEYSNQII
jgi:hypothetical protein